MNKEKPIDKVTTPLLYHCLKAVNVDVSIDYIDHIIDIIEILEEKGGSITIDDLIAVRKKWAGLTDSNS